MVSVGLLLQLVSLRRRVRRLLLGGGGIGAHLLDDGVGSRRHPAGDVPRLEGRQHLGLQDHAGQGVGKNALHAVADFDPHLVFGRHDDEEGAVVGPLLPDAPLTAELIAIVGDVVALQRGQGHHHELARGLVLQPFQLVFERRDRCGGQDVSVVHHSPAESREGERGGVGRRGER